MYVNILETNVKICDDRRKKFKAPPIAKTCNGPSLSRLWVAFQQCEAATTHVEPLSLENIFPCWLGVMTIYLVALKGPDNFPCSQFFLCSAFVPGLDPLVFALNGQPIMASAI